MKLTIEGPDNHDFLQSIINGEYVSLKDWPGAKLFVGSAYDKYLEMKKSHQGGDQVSYQKKKSMLVLGCATWTAGITYLSYRLFYSRLLVKRADYSLSHLDELLEAQHDNKLHKAKK